MNERIRELAEQAGFETDRGPLIVPGPYIKVGGLCVGVPLEKFAELVVRECCGAANDWYQKHNELHWDPAQHIRNHFGVEE
jgi:hypothetical protein